MSVQLRLKQMLSDAPVTIQSEVNGGKLHARPAGPVNLPELGDRELAAAWVLAMRRDYPVAPILSEFLRRYWVRQQEIADAGGTLELGPPELGADPRRRSGRLRRPRISRPGPRPAA